MLILKATDPTLVTRESEPIALIVVTSERADSGNSYDSKAAGLEASLHLPTYGYNLAAALFYIFYAVFEVSTALASFLATMDLVALNSTSRGRGEYLVPHLSSNRARESDLSSSSRCHLIVGASKLGSDPSLTAAC